MKKVFYLMLLIILMPINIYANELVDNCYIDATVQGNGDILVKELWKLNGNYKNLERIINIENNFEYIKYIEPTIYNADDVEIISIKGIDIDRKYNYDYLYKDGENFKESTSSELTEYGTYKIEKDASKIFINIYNPAKHQKAFYIEYILKNKTVKHNDFAEVNLNLLNNQDNIKNLEIGINIIDNKKMFNLFSANIPFYKIHKLSKQEAKIKLKNVNNNLDLKITFDLDSVKLSNKVSNINIENYLITEKDQIKDLIDMDGNISNSDKNSINNILKISFVWLIGVIILILIFIVNRYETRKKYNKFPSKDDPAIVNYLIKTKVDSKALLGSIISLISEEKVNLSKDGNEFILSKGKTSLNPLDEKLIKFIFGNQTSVSLKDIQQKIKKYPAKVSEELGSFYSRVILENRIKFYYKNDTSIKIIKYIYSLIGMSLGFYLSYITFNKSNLFYIGIVFIILSLLLIYIVSNDKPKTKLGREESDKWIGLKNHLKKYNRDVENGALRYKIYSYGIVLDANKHLSKSFDVKFINDFISSYNKILGRKINRTLKKAHKIEAGMSSEDTSKINYTKGVK